MQHSQIIYNNQYGANQQPVNANQRHPPPNVPYYNNQRQTNSRSGHMQASGNSRLPNMNGTNNINGVPGGPSNPNVIFSQICTPQPAAVLQYNPAANPGVQAMNNFGRAQASWPAQQQQQYMINHPNQYHLPNNSFTQFTHPSSVYFTPQMMMQQQSQMQTASTGTMATMHPPNPPVSASHRENKALPIVNPDTGLALSLENLRGPQSSRNTSTPPNLQSRTSSATSTSSEASGNVPVRNEASNEIAAQFATQVAALVGNPPHSAPPIVSHSNVDKFTAAIENKEAVHEKPPTSHIEEHAPVTNKDIKESAPVNNQDNTDSSMENVPNGDIIPEKETPAAIATLSEDASSESGGSKKKKGKQHFKNLNDKGKDKEGGEMDAFLDNPEKEIVQDSIPSKTVDVKDDSVIVQPKIEFQQESSIEILAEEPKDDTITNGPQPNASESAPIESAPEENVNKENAEANFQEVAEVEPKEDTMSEEAAEAPEEEYAVSAEETEASETKEEMQPAFQLKYDYKPDQWSPVNTEGKKQYDRSFLIQLQFDNLSTTKPQGLPNLDVIKDKPAANSPMSLFDFTPGFVQSSKGKGSQQSIQRKSSQQGKNNSMRRINLNVDVQLHQAENAWKPSAFRKSEETAEGGNMKIVGKARTILNKLTPSNFSTLANDFGMLTIDTESKMSEVIELLFNKALDEPKFVFEYAQLCKSLSKLKVIGSKGQEVKFQKMILTRCQGMFETNPLSSLNKESRLKEIEEENDPSKKAILVENWNTDEGKAKRQILGNIRFIGELYKLKLLTGNIIYECYQKLWNGPRHEMSIECLCTLITHAGKELELEARDKTKTFKFNENKLEEFYNQIFDFGKVETDKRTKFMIRDVTELKQNNWVPRRTDTGPKTIDEIHKQAFKEQMEMQQHLQNIGNSGKRLDDNKHSRRKAGYSSSQNANEDGWSTVVNSKPRHTFDPVKLKSFQNHMASDENIQLGPGGSSFKMWGSGSNGGNKSSSDSTNMRPPTNRFNALQYGNEIEERPNYAPRSGPPSRDSSVGRQSSSSGRRPSQPQRGGSKERQDVLNSVSNITKPDNAKREQRSDPEESEIDPLSEVFRKRCHNIADEAIQLGLNGDVMKDVNSVLKPSTAKYFVVEIMFHTLERDDNTRLKTSQFFKALLDQDKLTEKGFADGLVEVLSQANDLIVDIPQFWKYISQLIASIFRIRSSLKVIIQTAQQLPDIANKLVSVALNAAVSEMGEEKVACMWKASEIDLSKVIQGERVEDFINKNSFNFLMKEDPKAFNPDFVREELLHMLCTADASNDEIMSFINGFVGIQNVDNPQFIRALIVAVFKSGISGEGSKSMLDKDVCAKRASLCQKFISSKAELELEALYGVQRMLYMMDFPLGAVRLCFDFLYDEEIISEEAFCQWEKDPREKDGHAILMKSLTSFFIWLKEADNENSVGAPGTARINSVDASARHHLKSPPSPQ